jgi:hypothetical protein
MNAAVVARALQNKIPPRLVQPVEDFQLLELLDALQCRAPAFVDLDAADRPVELSLTRAIFTLGPRGTDHANEKESCVDPIGKLDQNFAGADRLPILHTSSLSRSYCHCGVRALANPIEADDWSAAGEEARIAFIRNRGVG